METFTDVARPRATGLRLGMVDILDGWIELAFLAFAGTTVFGASVGENPPWRDVLRLEERQDPVVEHVGVAVIGDTSLLSGRLTESTLHASTFDLGGYAALPEEGFALEVSRRACCPPVSWSAWER